MIDIGVTATSNSKTIFSFERKKYMNTIFRPVLFLLFTFFSLQNGVAQKDSSTIIKTYRIGIFAPLYLDSVFNEEGRFRFSQGMPQFMVPGVDFVNGVQIALDSIRLQQQNVNAYIYDAKSYTTPV